MEYVFNDKANQDATVNKTAIALLGDLASYTSSPNFGYSILMIPSPAGPSAP